ncbi:MAG: hypothetical protein JWN11_2469 [Hyphomicrobiales bacterium]|nr:hypothetical protein [Hyphomicrobiales bacterium]
MSDTTWPSTPPTDCPFPQSPTLRGITFTGRNAHYTNADTWYPSWGSDDVLYTPWTDGSFGEEMKRPFDCSSKASDEANAGRDGNAGTGQARIIGNDPLALTVENLGIEYASPAPYGGRYPCGSLMHNGIWYYGTYCLDESGRTAEDGRPLNWDILGPFVGFRISRDFGKTWEETPHTPVNPLFGETGKNGGKIKIGTPHVVDFGKNMQHSPDGKAYLVGHGAVRPDAELAWICGDQSYLCRVTPSPETMNDPGAYEFFGGHDAAGKPIWTNDFSAIKPLLDWQGRIGHATITYNAPLKKYLYCITDGGNTISSYNSYILESDAITGPWKLVSFMERFGQQAYFLNIPSKFISGDGRTVWLCYSANFTNHYLGTEWAPNPPGSQYSLCLQEMKLGTVG